MITDEGIIELAKDNGISYFLTPKDTKEMHGLDSQVIAFGKALMARGSGGQSGKDTPLKVCIEYDQLVVRIGIDTLAFADKQRTGLKVTNPAGFSRDVLIAMIDEDEVGATIVTDMLDSAMERARDDGSEWVEY